MKFIFMIPVGRFRRALVCIACILFFQFLTFSAFAQYTKLLDLGSSANGANPYSTPFSDGTFLYGMTANGGTSNVGTIYKMKLDGTGYTKLLDFDGITSGANPYGAFISDGVFLYAMTTRGGANDHGTIFKIKPDGTGYVTLFDFNYATTGAFPYGSLIFDGTFLYGMAQAGGTGVYGTVFKIKPDGTGYSQILNFDYTSNGGYPYGSLVSDGTFLYGMTSLDGINDNGTVFKVKPDGSGYAKILNFSGASNGSSPRGSLFYDGAFLYGMTRSGGSGNNGVIFKIMPDGTGFVKLLDFNYATQGGYPLGSLISDGTFLYGMTSQGGAKNGTIFKIMPNGTGFVKLYDDDGNSSGSNPEGTLVLDGTTLYGARSGLSSSFYGQGYLGTLIKVNTDGSNYAKLINYEVTGNSPEGSLALLGGFLYGMTYAGGANNYGTIYKVQTDGTGYAKLFDFIGTTTGTRPIGGRLISFGGYLYGMTSGGGLNDLGTIFKILPDGTGYTTLLDFDDATNGSSPNGSLINDGTYLYGMTSHGGAFSYGTIFKILPDGTGYTKLYDFDDTNGSYPNGSLFGSAGVLYGMTSGGGTNGGWGTLFKISVNGTGFAKLIDFDLANTGGNPNASLVYDGSFFYGMTRDGGANGDGTIFKIAPPNGTGYAKLLDFDGANNGSFPTGSLTLDGSYLYGMTSNGGSQNNGTLFKIKPDGSGYIKLMDFNDGFYPKGSLVSDGTFLYGVTQGGGANGLGVVFKTSLTPFTSIASFDPTDGVEGTTVTITGTAFDPTPANNTVKFNNTPAVVSASSSTSITTMVPVGATTGPISVTAFGTDISINDFTVTNVAVMVNGIVQNCNIPFQAPTYLYIQAHGYNPVVETFVPVNPTDKVRVSFSSFNVGDILYVYDGPTTASPLIATLQSATVPNDIVATGPGGELTFVLSWQDSDSSWDGVISCGPPGGNPPVITPVPLTTQVGGKITLDLVPLISTPNSSLNLSSLAIVTPPASGASASIDAAGVLTIDYNGTNFSGAEQISIRACDVNGSCATQVFNIDVVGDIVVYNGISPNGDGNNDFFNIQNIELLPDTKNNTVAIFDRWENMVWHASNYNNGSVVFKGVSDGGKDLPAGVYYYKIDFAGGRKTQTGFISLRK